MGKRGGKKGGRGRGGFGTGGGDGRPRRDNRTNKADVVRRNVKYEGYYNGLQLVPEDEKEAFWEALRRDLPNSFRFTGSKAHALAVQQRLRDFYIPEITSITYEGQYVPAPQPVPWYPDQLAWFMTTPKNVIRRFPPFASFQKFLVAETDVGNISRQEVVSMIPPLLMDIKPGMTVLDLCAAPGSKSAQLIEMIHAGEEERAQEVASCLANGLDRPAGDEYEDDGRSKGLLIANDVDYKRAHMLVHQMKRLSSPNIIVTNHDATIFPSIKIPSTASADGKPVPNRYLKFDRILADVPCSGDGTSRKNLEIWSKWTPSNGLGLHLTQTKILIRALQMLKVGGRVVYSTCSMNPVEDEAVLAAAIDRCGGPTNVQLLDTSDYLPGLKRCPGLRRWNIMDKVGRTWNSFQEVVEHKNAHGEDGLSRLQESMFPPKFDLPLEKCMRVYAHQQDTGAFFIAILEKKSEIKVRSENNGGVAAASAAVAVMDVSGVGEQHQIVTDGPSEHVDSQLQGSDGHDGLNGESALKRKFSNEETPPPPLKRVKPDEIEEAPAVDRPTEAHQTNGDVKTQSHDAYKMKKKDRDQPFEEPYKYLDSSLDELDLIRNFYTISPRFPMDRFMVRNSQSTPSKNIYYTTALAKSILQENEGKGMKFVHSGIKMFVKQDVPKPEVCPWRIQTDGLPILEAWVGKERIVKLTKRETLRKLLIEMFPRFHGEDWRNLGEIGEQIRDITMGCCVLIVEPTGEPDGLAERMVFPLWKSLHSLNLMLPKEDRKAMLLRLFNDDTPLVNINLNNAAKAKVAEVNEDDGSKNSKRNSSSERDICDAEPKGEEHSEDDDDDGAVQVAEDMQSRGVI